MVLYKNMTVHNGSWAIVSEYDDPVDVYIFRLYQGGGGGGGAFTNMV